MSWFVYCRWKVAVTRHRIICLVLWFLDLILEQQWLPNQSNFPPISWPWYRAWPSSIMSGFHGAFATGVAYQQGTLTLPDTWFRPPLWDLLVFQLLRPDSSNLPCLYSTFHLFSPLGTFSILLLESHTPRMCVRVLRWVEQNLYSFWIHQTSDILYLRFQSNVTNWFPGQPDQATTANCATINYFGHRGWDDMPCGTVGNFICEKPSDLWVEIFLPLIDEHFIFNIWHFWARDCETSGMFITCRLHI